MVATRKSQSAHAQPSPSTAAADVDNHSDPNNPDTHAPTPKKLKNALRKLQIDGTSALVGDSPPQKPQGETYHWRGTCYVVTSGTRWEWIDSQPKRYKTQQNVSNGRSDSAHDDSRASVRMHTSPTSSARDSSPITSGQLDFDHDGRAEQDCDASQEQRIVQEYHGSDSMEANEGEEENDTNMLTRRSGRNVPLKYYGRRKRGTSSLAAQITTPRRRHQQQQQQQQQHSYTMPKCGAVQNIESEEEGEGDEPHISPMVLQFARAGNPQAIAALKTRRELAESQGREVHMLSDTIHDAKEKHEAGVAKRMLFRLAKLNEEIENMQARYEQAKTELPGVMDALRDRSGRRPAKTPRLSSLAGTGYPTKPTTDLPTENRGGHPLRWSISLSQHLGNGERAEAHINRSRLDGESKPAHRRRLRRETQLVNAWNLERDREQSELATPATTPACGENGTVSGGDGTIIGEDGTVSGENTTMSDD